MELQLSVLQKTRMKYQLNLPKQLSEIEKLVAVEGKKLRREKNADTKDLSEKFQNTFDQPLISFSQEEKASSHSMKKVGVVFSGGQAPGGHNVLAGLFDALKVLNKDNKLYGFLGGPCGIVSNRCKEITLDMLATYRNQGGFDLIGSGRGKIETDEQFASVDKTCRMLDLDGLVIVGGDDSNTNAALIAEYFKVRNRKTVVVGVPKTIDGDLKSSEIEVSFGFDTACKVYSELIGNILMDCLSAKKYYHFIKLMGRSASHIALECALQTHPNVTIIGEEVLRDNKTLHEVSGDIANIIFERSEDGKNYGVILVPEGLIEFIPEIKKMIGELNELLSSDNPTSELINQANSPDEEVLLVNMYLTPDSANCFSSLPSSIQKQLLEERDPHGNVQVSRIETEKLLMKTVSRELDQLKTEGRYKGKFSTQHHFFGYEGRSAMPSNFDCHYCNALGYVAALLINWNLSGYMAVVKGLMNPVEDWVAGGVPLASMISIERRGGKEKPVIEKAMVNLLGKPFLAFKTSREAWSKDDSYSSPGPIQFFGEREITDRASLTLMHESSAR